MNILIHQCVFVNRSEPECHRCLIKPYSQNVNNIHLSKCQNIAVFRLMTVHFLNDSVGFESVSSGQQSFTQPSVDYHVNIVFRLGCNLKIITFSADNSYFLSSENHFRHSQSLLLKNVCSFILYGIVAHLQKKRWGRFKLCSYIWLWKQEVNVHENRPNCPWASQ